jgi:hypothetical protein
MRLAETYLQLLNFVQSGPLAAHFEQRESRGNYYYDIINPSELRVKLQDGLLLPVVGHKVESILFSDPMRISAKTISVEQKDFYTLKNLAQEIDAAVATLIAFVFMRLPQAEEGTERISVKLGNGQQFSVVVEKVERLESLLSQALSVLEDTPIVHVEGWETGSLWIDLAVGSSAAVFLIGGISWAATCVLKKYQEAKILEKMCEGLSIKNDALRSIQEAADDAVKAVVTAEARRLDSKHSKKSGEPETIQRLEHCIRGFFEMIKEGTEIHPSLTAPEAVQNVFPKLGEVLGLESGTKLLNDADTEKPSASNDEVAQ